MNRREVLRNSGWIAATGLLAPGVIAALQSCRKDGAGIDWTPQVLTSDQAHLLAVLSNTIVPATDTPSASEVRVPEFIDLIMTDVLSKDQNRSITEGLDALEQISQDKVNHTFTTLDEEDRYNLVNEIDAAAFENDPDQEYEDSFLTSYKYLKALILMSYFSSEEGVKQNLHYVVTPGYYKGCIDLPEDGKVMVGNHM